MRAQPCLTYGANSISTSRVSNRPAWSTTRNWKCPGAAGVHATASVVDLLGDAIVGPSPATPSSEPLLKPPLVPQSGTTVGYRHGMPAPMNRRCMSVGENS
ncbi:MAG: hypothetical protein JWR40_4535 [Massilia sp.]|jgi:hypothetical protein|nr:hypothetical protein [Massilia sp.]